jgi:AraC-like DNA-binding protein
MNRHRIEEAKKRLSDPAFANKNILEIMLETGFYSKSTFNTAFRKFTGSSPSDYRRNNL